jgi:transglutaminase-like putative cysteine protease
MEKYRELFVIGWMFFFICIEVFLMILADLWSGTRKAKERGEKLTSAGYKRSIDKAAKYYNALLALSIMDLMQIFGVWYLDNFYTFKLPEFPLMTLIGALCISLIEIKSILEKSGEKAKKETADIAKLAAEIVKHSANPEEIAKAVADYLQTDESK